MKVLLCNTYLYRRGGAEVSLFDLARLLKRKGHDVVFFGMKDEKNEVEQDPELLMSPIEFRDYRPGRIIWNLKAFERVIASGEARQKVRALVERERPDIVHVGNVVHHISPSILKVFEESGIPVVMFLRDYKVICPNSLLLNRDGICERCVGSRFYNALLHRCKRGSMVPSAVASLEAYVHKYRRVYDSVRAFVAPSRFSMEKLSQFGMERKKLFYLPEFVDPADYPVPDAGSQDYFVYFGRLSREKGLDTLLHAASLSGRKLILIGEGEEGEMLARRRAELGADNVLFSGRLGQADLSRLVGGSLFSVLPSACYETFGRSAIESFALGRTLVASRIGALEELIDDGVDGLLFEPGNAKDLARKIERFFENPDEARAMGRKGREKVLRRFTPEIHYEGLLRIWGKITDGRLPC